MRRIADDGGGSALRRRARRASGGKYLAAVPVSEAVSASVASTCLYTIHPPQPVSDTLLALGGQLCSHLRLSYAMVS